MPAPPDPSPLGWTFDFESEPGLLLITVTGTMTHAAMVALGGAVYADPRSPGVRGVLADYSAVDTSRMTVADSRALAADIAGMAADESGPPTAIAISAGQGFGLAAVFRGHISGRRAGTRLRVFTSAGEALAWLRTAAAAPGRRGSLGPGPGPAA